MQNVLVIFAATNQETESLALAVGLGAVQAGANIRLRHLDPSPSVELAHAGYGTLRVDDLRWVEGVAIILEGKSSIALGELKSAFDAIAPDAPNTSKWFYLFHVDPNSELRRSAEAVFTGAGFQELPGDPSPSASMEYMTAIGHTLAAK
ncbi:MAG: hypothetical protein JWQ42_816 [Edaphobacter sp.]|nr:hypothetical protein [Edaphobacter sp.]